MQFYIDGSFSFTDDDEHFLEDGVVHLHLNDEIFIKSITELYELLGDKAKDLVIIKELISATTSNFGICPCNSVHLSVHKNEHCFNCDTEVRLT